VRSELPEEASRLTDNQLTQLLEEQLNAQSKQPYPSLFVDGFLVEMVRRNRPEFREQIRRWAQHPPMAPKADKPGKERHGEPETPRSFSVPLNMQLVTALRRLDHQPDPLRIKMKGSDAIETRGSALPSIHVSVQNIDAAGLTLGLWQASDDDSGRPSCWRLDLKDEKSRAVRQKSPFLHKSYLAVSYNFRTLEPRQQSGWILDLNEYFDTLPPGRYRLTLHYDNEGFIAKRGDSSDGITFTSEPFQLIAH
jgi:hypothetical protein